MKKRLEIQERTLVSHKGKFGHFGDTEKKDNTPVHQEQKHQQHLHHQTRTLLFLMNSVTYNRLLLLFHNALTLLNIIG